jgi:Cd2+/Zn2+-exporting ATPase
MKIMASNIKIARRPVNIKLSDKNNIKKEFILEGLGCANCAAKMELKINELEGVHFANVNFLTKTLTLEIKEINKVEELIASAINIVTNIEGHVKVKEKEIGKVLRKEILLQGLCCANCAAKIERESNSIVGVKICSSRFCWSKVNFRYKRFVKTKQYN